LEAIDRERAGHMQPLAAVLRQRLAEFLPD
jgi:hypothetical protein